jgi:lectin family protein
MMRKKIGHLVAIGSLVFLIGGRAAAATPVIQLDFNDPAAGDQVQLNGIADLVPVGGRQHLRLAEDFGQAGSAWLRRPLQLPAYTVEFDFTVTRTDPADQPADGFTFTAQEYGPVALGDGGGGLGYTGIPGYSYAVEFNTYAAQGLRDNSETVAIDVVGARAKLSQVPFPHIDRGVLHAAISVRREGIEVTVSGGKENLAPRKVLVTPWWILFDTNRPLWFGFTGATGGLRSTIDILNLTITPLP